MSTGYRAYEHMGPDTIAGSTYQLRVTDSQEAGPDVVCKAVLIKAAGVNTGKIYVNYKTGVKILGTADDPLVGFELAGGETTPWLPTGGNLSNLYFIASVTNQDLTLVYLV